MHCNFPQFVPAHVLCIERGVPDGFFHSRRRERHCPRYVRPVLRRHIKRFIEAVYLAGNLGCIARGIEARDAPNAAAAGSSLPPRTPLGQFHWG